MVLLLLVLVANLAHQPPLNPTTNARDAGAQVAIHSHLHDAPPDDTDGDMNGHVHPAADRVADGWVQRRFAGAAPLYQRTRRIALRWPSTIPLKPPSMRSIV